MGVWKPLAELPHKIGAALGRGMDKLFGDQPDSSAAPGASGPSPDPLWSIDAGAAGLPPELRGTDSDPQIAAWRRSS